MSTYYINFYPKGLDGDSEHPEAYAYSDDAFSPVNENGYRIKVTVPDTLTLEVVK